MVFNIIWLSIGLIAGATITWLFVREQIRNCGERARAEGEVQRTALAERLQAKEQQVQSQTADLNWANDQISTLRAELKTEAERRATAEEKNTRIPVLEADISQHLLTIGALQADVTTLKAAGSALQTTIDEERKAASEKLALMDDAKRAMLDAFSALSAEALKSNNQSFLDLAKATLDKYKESAQSDLTARQKAIDELVKPLTVSLEKVDGKIAEIEKERTSSYATLTEQVKSLASTQVQLHCETSNLVKALRAPQVRGRWGEIQMKRVVEMAGMVDHCDFFTQESVTTEDGRLRPDLVVKLPGGKNVVADAKCPLQGYQE